MKRIKTNINLREEKGYIMVVTVGILCLLIITAIAFTITTNFEIHMASSFKYSTTAKYLAEAGMKRAISELRNQAVTDFIWDENDVWYALNCYQDATLLDERGEYTVLSIIDCSAQININDVGSANLDRMLAELENIDFAEAGNLINYRDNLPGGQFDTKEQVKQVPGLIDGGESYDKFKDYITVHSYVDKSVNRSPININTAKKPVLMAVLRWIMPSPAKADALADKIIAERQSNPFGSWKEFNDFIDGVNDLGLTAGNKLDIKKNANPNRDKPAQSTTEFCFHAGGYFEIQSQGTFYKSSSQSTVLSQKNITSIAQTHNVMYKTTKADFNEDLNYNGTLDAGEDTDNDGGLDFPTWHNANWQDSCPVLSSDDNGLTYASGYETIPGSIKLGFWDNFDEDNDNEAKKGWSFYNWYEVWISSGSMNVSDANSDADAELWAGSSLPENIQAKFELKRPTDNTIWACDDNFSLRIHATDPVSWDADAGGRFFGDGWEDAAFLECTKPAGTQVKLWIGNWGFLYGSPDEITVEGWTVNNDPDMTARRGKDFFDSQIRLYFWDGSVANQERLGYLGDIFYDIPVCPIEYHYWDWADDYKSDDYHGVMPTEVTFKFVVSDSYGLPDYRVYLAVGNAWHIYYRYNNGNYDSSKGYNPSTTNYINVPLHNNTETTFNRYGYWTPGQSGPNQWRDVVNGWWLGLWSSHVQTKWDDVRIIPSSGWYQSPWHNVPEGQVRWAAISWTETIPATADPASEQISVSVDTGSGLGAATFNGSIDALSNQFKFKVDLTSADFKGSGSGANDVYSETPVFEDITVTYIIPTKIHYWKEFKIEE